MERTFRRICVFCGSNDGNDPSFTRAAHDLGKHLATHKIGVVYGGARVGMMGALADGALGAGGEVIGVIPEKLQALEVTHQELSELFVVESMHARKAMMAHLADAFIALPGGWGTLEEVFEVTTWTQLNYHRKPVGLLNVNGYFDKILDFVHHAVATGFIRDIHKDLMQSAATQEELLEKLRTADIPEMTKWIQKP